MVDLRVQQVANEIVERIVDIHQGRFSERIRKQNLCSWLVVKELLDRIMSLPWSAVPNASWRGGRSACVARREDNLEGIVTPQRARPLGSSRCGDPSTAA